MIESMLARIVVLEQSKNDHSDSNRPRCVLPASASTHTNDETGQSAYKILEAALARVTVLEKMKDISYHSAFKASDTVADGKNCIVRGCGGKLSVQKHLVRHLNATPTPEHQVAAIILQQTQCLECDQSWKRPSGLSYHEATVHKEDYALRMDIFRPFFEQISSKVLPYCPRKRWLTACRLWV